MRLHVAALAAWIFAASLAADEPSRKNPLERDPAAVAAGKVSYDGRCSGCHGADMRGGRGPDLHNSPVAKNDRRLFSSIKDGMPGTEMLPQDLTEEQTWQIVAYVAGRTRPGLEPPLPGDPEAGRRIFEQSGCARCHMVGGQGGVVGPNLSSIALQRMSDEIRDAVSNPSAKIPWEYRRVEGRLRSGEAFRGAVRNEDNFSMQIMRVDSQLLLVDRSDLAELRYAEESLMPVDYEQRLSADQLRDLLCFLDRQRAPFVHYEKDFRNY